MLSEDKGIKAIIALQEMVGIEETEEKARNSWNNVFGTFEKEQTELAHKHLCGGFKDEETD